jgi:BASS family bile acid:Na+ symporter
VVVGVVYHSLTLLMPRIVILMPAVSMAGIIAFTAITTAAGRENLLRIGWLLLVAVILHNLIGYSLGYWISRGCGLDKNSARTVSLEVGIHNGGMATGLASHLGSIGTLGLAAAIFSPWMNVSGSILANYWRRRAERESP